MFDRMSPEKLARAKGQAQSTNEINALALLANGYRSSSQGATGAESRIAEGLLIERFGRRKANRLIQQTARKIRDTF